MIRLILLMLLSVAEAAHGEVARVRGGEHADFTRIVISAKTLGDWKLVPTASGYELMAGEGITDVDLTQAFMRIPRSRLADLRWAAETGGLHFDLNCECGAVATAYRPDMVVIDISDVPKGDPADSRTHLVEIGYEWWSRDSDPAAPSYTGEAPETAEALGRLRNALLQQISEGAAAGMIELVPPPVRPDSEVSNPGATPGVRVALGEIISLTDPVGTKAYDRQGMPCPDDAELDFAGLLPSGPGAGYLALTRMDLLGEFDRPEDAAILRAARLLLALGFGAEARQLLDLLPGRPSPVIERLRTISWVLDEEEPPGNAFAGLAGCNSAAALWALLAGASDPGAVAQDQIDLDAVLRGFSALPPHLRQQFGPFLLERLQGFGESDAIIRLRDAARRGQDPSDVQIKMMEIEYQLDSGNRQTAEALAQSVMTDPRGLAAEAALLLTETAFDGRRHVPDTLADQLASLQADHPQLRSRLLRAEALAAAMQGEFARAFAVMPDGGGDVADLWLLAATAAPPDIFLQYAIAGPPPDLPLPGADPDVRTDVASRLLDMGFPDQAELWLGPVNSATPETKKLLSARAALLRRDARQALRLVAGLNSPTAEALRANAARQLGDGPTAAAAFARMDDPDARLAALKMAADWSAVAQSPRASTAWQVAARIAVENPVAGQPGLAGPVLPVPDRSDHLPAPIADGLALAEASAASRAAIGLLLRSVALPADQE